jgi:hypothetical protein
MRLFTRCCHFRCLFSRRHWYFQCYSYPPVLTLQILLFVLTLWMLFSRVHPLYCRCFSLLWYKKIIYCEEYGIKSRRGHHMWRLENYVDMSYFIPNISSAFLTKLVWRISSHTVNASLTGSITVKREEITKNNLCTVCFKRSPESFLLGMIKDFFMTGQMQIGKNLQIRLVSVCLCLCIGGPITHTSKIVV